jgi:tetratricopeptide (TPR) repeat protein
MSIQSLQRLFIAAALLIAADAGADFSDRDLQAQKLVKASQWKETIALLSPNMEKLSPKGSLMLASAYAETRDWFNVAKVFAGLSEKLPMDAEIFYAHGDALLKSAASGNPTERRNRENQAVEALRKAIQLNRKFQPAHRALVNYFLASKMNNDAREGLEEMVEIFGERDEIFSDLCRSYTLDGFYAQSVNSCRRALELAPQMPDNFIYLAQAHFDHDEKQKAETLLLKAAGLFEKSEFAQYGAGQFFISKGNWAVAQKYLNAAVKNDPKSIRAHSSLGKACFELGQFTAALENMLIACKGRSALQEELLTAASRLRVKGDAKTAGQFAQAAVNCGARRP